MQQGQLETPFFVSSYICGDEDRDDTNIGQLPPNLRWNGIHSSVRFRFRAIGNVEQNVEAAIQNANANYWKSGFLNYPITDNLSGNEVL